MTKNKMGMVMEILEPYAVVLTRDGAFVKTKIPKAGCHIGDEIPIRTGLSSSFLGNLSQWFRHSRPRQPLRFAVGVCGLLAFGVVSWASPVGYVYMDVNPSLAIGYNLYERVVSYESFNEDGEAVKNSVSVYGKTIEDTVEASLLAMDEKGFVKEASSGLILGFSTESEAVKEKAIRAVTKAVDKTQKSIEVGSVQVEKSQMAQAKELEATPIEVAIATEKNDSSPIKTTVAAKVKAMKNQTTAEIIEKNPSVLKVKYPTLEKVKEAIALKKANMKAQPKPEKEKLNKEQQENNKQSEEQSQAEKENKKEKPTQKPTENQNHAAPSVREKASQSGVAVTPKARETMTETVPLTEEEGMDFTQVEREKGTTGAEKLEKLLGVRQQLEAVRAKLIQSKLPEKEKNKRLEQVDRQLLKVDALIRRLENKKK